VCTYDVHDPARRPGDEGALMRKLVRLAAVIAGTAGLSVAGIAAAYANWTVPSAPVVIDVETVAMPSFHSAPAVQPHGRGVSVSWAAQRIHKGVKVERYIVVRHDASGRGTQVCDAAATTCRDTAVPDGAWTYTVRTGYASWRGPESPASVPVIIGHAAEPPETSTATTEAASLAVRPEPAATTVSPATSAAGLSTSSPPQVVPAESEPENAAEATPPPPSTPDATDTSEPAAPTDAGAGSAAN
jgi:hypothetical protein